MPLSQPDLILFPAADLDIRIWTLRYLALKHPSSREPTEAPRPEPKLNSLGAVFISVHKIVWPGWKGGREHPLERTETRPTTDRQLWHTAHTYKACQAGCVMHAFKPSVGEGETGDCKLETSLGAHSGLWCSSVVEGSPSMCKALGLIPCTAPFCQSRQTDEWWIVIITHGVILWPVSNQPASFF